jgi:ribosome-associated toxin RatA of RatAB toxin-antitoxin module
MAAVGEATTVIACPAEDILAFIMDVEAYKAVDPRLRTIKWVRRTENETVFRFRPELAGVPAPLSTQRVVLTPGKRVDIVQAPHPMNRMAGFRGLLECTPDGDGTRVRRRLEFRFAPPMSWLLDARVERWLAEDIPAELARLKVHLEQRSNPL